MNNSFSIGRFSNLITSYCLFLAVENLLFFYFFLYLILRKLTSFFCVKIPQFIHHTPITKCNATITKHHAPITHPSRKVTHPSQNITFTPLNPLLYKAVMFRDVFSLKTAMDRVRFLGLNCFTPILIYPSKIYTYEM